MGLASLLKEGSACFECLSMNGKSSTKIAFPPFVLSRVEGLRQDFSVTC